MDVMLYLPCYPFVTREPFPVLNNLSLREVLGVDNSDAFIDNLKKSSLIKADVEMARRVVVRRPLGIFGTQWRLAKLEVEFKCNPYFLVLLVVFGSLLLPCV